MTTSSGIDGWAEERQRMANERENKSMSKDMMIVKMPGRIDTSGASAAEARTRELVYKDPIQISHVGDGRVELIAGGGKIFTDIAARFVRSERDISEIISSDYSPEIVRNIINSGHLAATEFDMFIFAVSGYSRVCETQLVRKRMASYLIKSGRQELHGKRQYKVVYPKEIEDISVEIPLKGITSSSDTAKQFIFSVTPRFLNALIRDWYEGALATGKYKEQDLRYMKPQATMWQGIIGMNAHSLIDISRIRMCRNAQAEIRDLVTKMVKLAKEAAPDLMATAGPSCRHLGYCPEGKLQNKSCQDIIPTKEEALRYIRDGHAKAVAASENQREVAPGVWEEAKPLPFRNGFLGHIFDLIGLRK